MPTQRWQKPNNYTSASTITDKFIIAGAKKRSAAISFERHTNDLFKGGCGASLLCARDSNYFNL